MTPPSSTPGSTPGSTHDENTACISGVMNRLRVLIGRRMVSRVAIANVLPGAELSFIDALSHVPARPDSADEPVQGVSIGAVATAMRIDPSRASRLVAQMVDRDILARVASSEDGRSSRLVRTDLGQRLYQETQNVKMHLIQEAVDGWTPEEVEVFARLFDRFIGSWEQQIDAGDLSKIPGHPRSSQVGRTD